MDHMYYTLNGHEVVPVPTFPAELYEGDKDARRVGWTEIDAECHVSTVFLALNHNYFPGGEPVLFETMIFGGKYSEYQWRYHTWDEAEAGHNAIVRALQEGQHPEVYLETAL
jgi:hypothetical protein